MPVSDGTLEAFNDLDRQTGGTFGVVSLDAEHDFDLHSQILANCDELRLANCSRREWTWRPF